MVKGNELKLFITTDYFLSFRIEEQFSNLHAHPDMYVFYLIIPLLFFLFRIVATPGRFMHLCIEMDLKLHDVKYVVFDEADRYEN